MPQLNTESDRVRQVYKAYADAGLPESKWSLGTRGNRAIQHEILSVMVDMLADAGTRSLDDRRVLEIGCGDGGGARETDCFGRKPSAHRGH